jgi:hypothetical protein
LELCGSFLCGSFCMNNTRCACLGSAGDGMALKVAGELLDLLLHTASLIGL